MKKITTIFSFLLLLVPAMSYAQPANDLCADAIPIACGSTVSGTTTAATFDSIPNCGAATVTIGGVWYVFTGTGDAVTLSTCNQATYDTKIGVYDGTCASLNCVAGNDDGAGCAGFTSELTFNSVNGTDYYIFIHGYGSAQGDFDLTVTCSAPCTPVPANDLCSGATMLTVYPDQATCTPTMGTNECSTTNLENPSCFQFGNVQDVWYSFNTGPVYGVDLAFDTITGSTFYYALYENCGDPAILCSPLTGTGITDIDGLNNNTDYLLQIFNGGGPNFGSFNICISADTSSAAPPQAVANDECDSVIVLTEELTCTYTAASVFGATETIPADSCDTFLSAAALDVWFSFVCTNATTTIEVDPMFDPILQLRDACGGGNILGCSDNVGTVAENVTASGLIVGNTYYIRVYPWGNAIPADPTFNICVYEGAFIGVEENVQKDRFKLYPNPTNGILNIEYNHDISGKLQVINGMGQVVISTSLDSKVDLSSLNKGLYLVNIIDEKGISLLTDRVIVE